MTGALATASVGSAGSSARQPRTTPARLRVAHQSGDEAARAVAGARPRGRRATSARAVTEVAKPREHERALDPEPDAGHADEQQEHAAVDLLRLHQEERRR